MGLCREKLPNRQIEVILPVNQCAEYPDVVRACLKSEGGGKLNYIFCLFKIMMFLVSFSNNMYHNSYDKWILFELPEDIADYAHISRSFDETSIALPVAQMKVAADINI